MRKLLCGILALILACSMTIPALAANSDARDCIEKMVTYYRYYQDDAQLDLELLTAKLSEIDEEQARKWTQIMEFWSWVNTEMDIDTEILPDGLAQDDSLCIVVLGYALKKNGDMQSELIGRLETALACAEKYPNAYIACTGGGTARNNDSVTEAGEMAKWLARKGIDEARIIVEDESLSTVNNAQYTCELLHTQYPQVTQLAIVTSDYHQGRGPLLFQAESILCGYDMNVCSIASYRTEDHELDSLKVQANALAGLADFSIEDAKKPKLSKLTGITVSGDTQCQAGMELNLRVYAVYSTGLKKEVTMYSNFSGFDMNKAGIQTVTVKYAENDKLYQTAVDIEFLPGSVEILSTQPPATEPMIPEETLPLPSAAAEPESASLPLVIVSAAILLILLLILIRVKTESNKRKRRRKRKNRLRAESE